MSDHRSTGPSAWLWMVPCAYGLLLIGASVRWLATGEPFDHDSYARIGGTAWSAIVIDGIPADQTHAHCCLAQLCRQESRVTRKPLLLMLGLKASRPAGTARHG